MDDLYLEHHGILGQRWGVRRYQNPDGSLTEEGEWHRRALNASKTKNDVDRIWRSMSLDDRKMMGDDNPHSKEFLSFDEGEYVVKRFLDKDKDTPVAWLDIMTTTKPGHLTVAVGTDPAYRGQGRASKLVQQGVDWFDKNAHKYNATYLGYGAYANNIGSRRAAEKAGFVYEQDKSSKEWSVYGHGVKS